MVTQKHNCGEFLVKSSSRGPNNYDLELNCNKPTLKKSLKQDRQDKEIHISLSPRIEVNSKATNKIWQRAGKQVPKVEKYASKKVMLLTELEQT